MKCKSEQKPPLLETVRHSVSLELFLKLKHTSFTEQQIELMKKSGRGFVVEAAIYKVKAEQYSKQIFQVFIGNAQVSPFICDNPPEEIISQIKETGIEDLNTFLKTNQRDVEDVPSRT